MPAKKDIAVIVGGDTSDLKKGMKSGARSVTSFGKVSTGALKKVAGGLAKVAAAAVAAGAAIVVGLAKKGNEAVRELERMARVSNSGVKEFQRLAFGAKQLGVEQDKLGDILKDVNDRVGDFLTTGGGPMADFFETIGPKIGITVDHFKNLSGPQALQLFVSSLEKANLTQAETTFFMEAMASDLTLLLPLFQKNGDMAKKAGKEFDRFGGTLNAIEVQKVREADIAMDSFSTTVDSISKRVIVELAPALKIVSTKFADFVKENEGFKDAIRSSFKFAGKVIAVFADGLDLVQIGFKGLEFAAAGFASVFKQVISFAVEKSQSTIKAFIENTLNGIDSLTSKINEKLGTSLGKIGRPDLGFLDKIIAAGPESVTQLNQIGIELKGMVEQFRDESTGDSINKMFDTMIAGARRAAIEMSLVKQVSAQALDLNLDQQQPSGDDPKAQSEIDANREFQEILAARLEILQNSVKTELEVELEAQRKRIEELAFLEDQGVIRDEDRRRLQQELEAKHQKTLTDIRRSGLLTLEKFNSMSFKNQTKTALGEVVNLTSGVARENRALFEINKQAATAQAVIGAYEGISRTLAAYPAPFSFAMAAIQAGAAFAQVRAIQSQSFSGGGSSAPSIAGSTAAPPVQDVGGDAQQNVFINLEGDSFGQEGIRKLITKLNEATKNGARIVVN